MRDKHLPDLTSSQNQDQSVSEIRKDFVCLSPSLKIYKSDLEFILNFIFLTRLSRLQLLGGKVKKHGFFLTLNDRIRYFVAIKLCVPI